MKNKAAVKKWSISVLMILAAAVVRALAVQCFIVPNDFAPGGVTGIAAILEYKTGLSSGYTIFVLNLPILLFAYFKIGKEFAAKTAISITISSALLVLFQKTGFYTYVPDEKFLAATMGGILGGASLALMLKAGATMGGTDVIASFIQQRHSATNVSWFIFALDSTVVIASLFFYDQGLTPAILALSEMFFSSKTCEIIMNGFKSAIKFEVVTAKPREMSDAILSQLERGVTKLEAVGMYTQEPKSLLVCVIRRRQVSDFRRIIKEVDPHAFAYMSQASEVIGFGFPRG